MIDLDREDLRCAGFRLANDEWRDWLNAMAWERQLPPAPPPERIDQDIAVVRAASRRPVGQERDNRGRRSAIERDGACGPCAAAPIGSGVIRSRPSDSPRGRREAALFGQNP